MQMDKTSGRAKGGLARAEALTAKERKAIATQAAEARWSTEVLQATHGDEDHPLKIGEIEIPCYVLQGERRVLAQTGIIRALGMAKGGSSHRGGTRLAKFTDGHVLGPYMSEELKRAADNPIRFRTQYGTIGFGFEATLLADICDAVLDARKDGVLQKQQEHIAARCEILLRGFARVGIIALVDEATGFQRDRAATALARILEAFIAKELQKYVQTFPPDYYEQIFRLRGMEYPKDTVQRPRYFGILTNDLVYDRLAPGALEALKKANPKDEATGRRKHKNFQWLTSNAGYPKLREHLGAVVATMRMSSDWHDFKSKLDKHYPRLGKPTQLSFDYAKEEEADSGQGL
jgi:hypothetical protein